MNALALPAAAEVYGRRRALLFAIRKPVHGSQAYFEGPHRAPLSVVPFFLDNVHLDVLEHWWGRVDARVACLYI